MLFFFVFIELTTNRNGIIVVPEVATHMRPKCTVESSAQYHDWLCVYRARSYEKRGFIKIRLIFFLYLDLRKIC